MIYEQILSQAKHHANEPALWVEGCVYTYQALLTRAAVLMRLLHQISSGNTCCAIYAKRSVHAYVSILASFFAGKIFMPLSPSMPLARTAAMLSLANPSVLVIDANDTEARALLNMIAPTHVILFDEHLYTYCRYHINKHHYYLYHLVYHLDEVGEVGEEGEISFTAVSPQDYTYLLFTSGSTGQPKGIGITYTNLSAYIQNCHRLYHFSHQDRFAQISELTFDLSMHDIFLCWSSGATLYVLPENYILSLLNFINKHQISVCLLVPSTVSLLAQLNLLSKEALPSLTKTFFCGEPLLAKQAELWQATAYQTEMINMYGPTEATISFTHYRYSKALHHLNVVPIGKPLPHQQCAVVNEHGELVAKGEVGELCLSGTQVVTSYWSNNNLKRQVFTKFNWDKLQHLWYLTGDLVRWVAQDGYHFCGRVDDQWQIRGYRVEKLEVESAIQKIIGDMQVAVVPLTTENGTVTGIDAYVVSELAVSEIYQHLRLQLPDVMLPKHIHIVSELPKNIAGKVNYSVLKEVSKHAHALS